MKEKLGPHYAEAYRSKLEATTFSIFQKVAEKDKVDEKYFLLEDPANGEGEENIQEEGQEKKEKELGVKEEVVHNENKDQKYPKKNGKSIFAGRTAKETGKQYTGRKKLVRDPKTGLVRVAGVREE